MVETEALQAARGGDRDAFASLVAPHLPVLRSLIQRMVMHPQDADDLVQDTVIRALERIQGFRAEGTFRAWLLTIGSRRAIDFLRTKKRWDVDSQRQGARAASSDEDELERIADAGSKGEFVYEFRQHVSYCFSCVTRSLEPETGAVLLLRDVFEYSTRETADVVGLSQSVVRHRLSDGRGHMREAYEDMCALVNKRGYCHQCAGLRDALPTPRQGAAPVPFVQAQPTGAAEASTDAYRVRLPVVRNHDHTEANPLHDHVRRFMAARFD